MGNLTIDSGINSLGNYTDTDISLAGMSTNVRTVAILVNGAWKTWSNGTPDAWQGTTKIPKGLGFVSNATSITNITVSDNYINVNDIPMTIGLNFITFPFADKVISGGYLPRAKLSFAQTINGTWKSWVDGTPDELQTLTSVSKEKGIICNITELYNKYLNNNYRDNNTGVKIGTNYINVNEVQTTSDIEYIPDAVFNTIDYASGITINTSLAKLNLWVKIGTVTKLLKYPQEYAGTRFNFKEVNLNLVNNGLITDTIIITENNGTIVEAVDVIEDNGYLLNGYGIANLVYTGLFTPNSGNSEVNPLVLETMNLNAVEIMYNALTISATPIYNKMFINAGGDKFVIEFTNEYIGKPLTITKDTKVYKTTFTINDSFLVLN